LITLKQKLTAIKGSIEKWDKVSKRKTCGTTRANCPLCSLYFAENSCKGCPIYEKTGQEDCRGTPFKEYVEYSNLEKYNQDYIPSVNKTARKFRDWLKDLYIEVSEAGARDRNDAPEGTIKVLRTLDESNKIRSIFKDSHNLTHTQLEGKCDAIWERVEDIGKVCEERLKKVEEDIQLLKHHKEVTRIELDHHARAIFSLEELNKK